MIIDLENHLYLEDQTDKRTYESGKICERRWDKDGNVKISVSQEAASVEKFLQFMDDAGIDMAVLTNQGRKLEQQKMWHDLCPKLVKAYPKRFVGFATIDPFGGKESLDELERAVKDSGLKGVHIWTRKGETYLDSKEMWPFYEKVSELDIPVDVHISISPIGFDALRAPYALYYVMAREFDMAVSVLRVCLGGVLEEFPDLKLIMNHFGGGVSSVMERLDAYTGYAEGPGWGDFYFGKRLISKPWREYFNNLYFNMAGRELGIESLKCALTNISPKKLMFATDWPWNFDYEPEKVKQYMAEIRKLDLPQKDIDGMLGGNAAKLIGI